MKTLASILFSLLSLSLFGQNSVCFQIENNPNQDEPALNIFTKYIDVYGCSIYAEANVPDEKVLHAAAIWAELIDNNEDGIIDDPELLTRLQNSKAMMPIFQSEDSPNMEFFFENYEGEGVAAILWQQEIDPNNPGRWGYDATVEEILHTINYVGHVQIYPEAFSIQPNSSLMSEAMDIARGGQFLNIPNNYPEEAWYHYDDFTCDYECMMIEYMYWAIVSWMGILDDPQTCDGIFNEWETCTPELFMNTDVAMFNLITDPQYKLPQLAPDGNYCSIVLSTKKELSENDIRVYPNPANTSIFFSGLNNAYYQIFNSNGELTFEATSKKDNNFIDTSNFSDGVYIIRSGNQSKSFVIQK